MVNQDGWATRRLAGLLAATGVVTMIAGVLLGRYAFPAPDATATQPRGAEPVGRMQPSASSTVVARPSEGSGTGTSPPQAPTQTGRQLPGMPTRINEFGIPVGYPHTEAGAISACGNYVAAYVDRRNRDTYQIKKVFNEISITGVAEKLSERIISADSVTAKNFNLTSINSPQVSFNIRPIGYSIQSSNSNQVIVSIWSTASIGIYDNSGNLAPQQSWGTDICTVAWQNNDWKLSDAGDGPNGPSINERSAEGFERFAYVGRPAQ